MEILVSELFDIPVEVNYLNCASLAPQLKSVTEAGIVGVKRKAYPWNIQSEDWFSDAEILRSLAAKIINADAEGMALIPSVSYGISVAAANLLVKKGEQILVMDQEYPSNYYSWSELAKSNSAVLLTIKKHDRTWTDAILAAISEKTAIVAISNCHWTNGALVDVEQISKKAKIYGAALVIDASQSMGAHPIDVEIVQPDFMVSVGYKWLLGPYGLGYLYAAPKWREHGRPIEYSWLTKKGSENFASLVNYRDDFRPGARRFDMGEFPGFIHLPMAITALSQILSWQVSNIQSHLKAITGLIEEQATELGLSFPDKAERADHMIGLQFMNGIPKELKSDLQNAHVFVGYRGMDMRVSPYVYTTKMDITQLFEHIRKYV